MAENKRIDHPTGTETVGHEWDGIEDAEDERIFYYLDGEPAIGEHSDFVITETN